MRSLQWLRGWVQPKAVEQEFKELQRYNKYSNACTDCSKSQTLCTHPPPTMMEKLQELLRRRTMKPFLIVSFVFLFSQLSGFSPMRPFLVLILKAYGVPIDPNWATVSIEYRHSNTIENSRSLNFQSFLGLTGIFSNILLVCVIRFTGKRKMFIISLMGCASCCIALSKSSDRSNKLAGFDT